MKTAAWYGLAFAAGVMSFWLGVQLESSSWPRALPAAVVVAYVALLLVAARLTPGLRWQHRVAGGAVGIVATLAAFAVLFYKYAQHFS